MLTNVVASSAVDYGNFAGPRIRLTLHKPRPASTPLPAVPQTEISAVHGPAKLYRNSTQELVLPAFTRQFDLTLTRDPLDTTQHRQPMDNPSYDPNDPVSYGQHFPYVPHGIAASNGEQSSHTRHRPDNSSQQGPHDGVHPLQGGLEDLPVVDTAGPALYDEDDLLGPLWQSNYNIHAGPWNPIGMLDGTREHSYPPYQQDTSNEAVFDSHPIGVTGDIYTGSTYFSAHSTGGVSPSQHNSVATGSAPSATPPELVLGAPILLGKPVEQSYRDGGSVMGPPTQRPRRLSTKSDKTLPPCDICLREGKGRRTPKNHADQK